MGCHIFRMKIRGIESPLVICDELFTHHRHEVVKLNGGFSRVVEIQQKTVGLQDSYHILSNKVDNSKGF